MLSRSIIKIVLLLAIILLSLNFYALRISNRLLFRPFEPGFTELPGEFKIATSDGAAISAVWLEHPDAKLTLLFSHGNHEDLGGAVPFMARVRDMGWNVLLYDYRGYGLSKGEATSKNAKLDAAAAYRWLVEEKKINPKTIVSQGRSVGGAVATWIAANHEVGGLIVESSFVSAFRVKTRWPLLPFDTFTSLRSMRSVTCPTLITHGRDDSVIAFWHGEKLYAVAPEPKRFIWFDDSEHSNYAMVAEEEYFQGIQSFLEFVEECRRINAE